MQISVCMAAYRGERFIAEQIASVLPQLGEKDALLVSDDLPGGETERIVRAFAAEDSRVQYLPGPGKGVVCNFAHVLSCAAGDVIFLCDQDDVWRQDKVSLCMHEIAQGADLVLHDAAVVDADLHMTAPSFFMLHGSRPGFVHNILRNSYMGCCMAFTREILQHAMPFPEGIPMHDQWIGLVAERMGNVCFLPEPLILYRQHGGNVTGGQTTLRQKILWRAAILRALRK